MIDFIDPVLKASKQSKRLRKTYSFKHFASIVGIIVLLAAFYWMFFISQNSLLDTKPNQTIDVSDNIKDNDTSGRLPSIQETH